MTLGRVGSLIVGVFALIYVVVNAGARPSAAAPVLRALGVVAFAGLLVAIRRADSVPTSDVPARSGFGRGYCQLAGVRRSALAELHGMGPKALRIIEAELEQHGLRLR